MFHFLQKGILPQDWLPDYKNRNEVMKVTHRNTLIRILGWYSNYLQNQNKN
jgi:hypothetical protein